MQQIQYSRRKEGRQCRSDADVLDSQMEQRQQNCHSLLFVPGKYQREWQIVYTALKSIGQSQSDLQSRITVIALTDIEQTRKTANCAESPAC